MPVVENWLTSVRKVKQAFCLGMRVNPLHFGSKRSHVGLTHSVLTYVSVGSVYLCPLIILTWVFYNLSQFWWYHTCIHCIVVMFTPNYTLSSFYHSHQTASFKTNHFILSRYSITHLYLSAQELARKVLKLVSLAYMTRPSTSSPPPPPSFFSSSLLLLLLL